MASLLALLELASGYQCAKTLFALVESDLPTLLAQEPLSVEQIARQLRIHPVAADRFLNACVALGLLERCGDRFRNAPVTDRFLVRGKASYLGDYFMKHDRQSFPRWAELMNNLRAWRPGTNATSLPADEEASARAQHNMALIVGEALGRAFDFSAHRRLLDLGGGTGAMSISLCRAYDRLRAMVFDLPPVIALARRMIRQAGLTKRIETRAGDFKNEELPEGFDVILLANLLSTASEKTNRRLFRRLYASLPANGCLIISGWILDDTRTSPLLSVLFCLEDICWRAPDVERAATTYRAWLSDAGFTQITHQTYCPPTSMIVARKTV